MHMTHLDFRFRRYEVFCRIVQIRRRIGQYCGSIEAELVFLVHDVVNPRRPGVAYAGNLQAKLTQALVHHQHVCASSTTHYE